MLLLLLLLGIGKCLIDKGLAINLSTLSSLNSQPTGLVGGIARNLLKTLGIAGLWFLRSIWGGAGGNSAASLLPGAAQPSVPVSK